MKIQSKPTKKNQKGPKEIIMECIHLQKFKQPINIMIVLHYDKYQKNGKARQMIAIR